ncbi:MAG: hypothetical protein HN929_10185, partial [Chloroflexi bacterium]|nr:hypothetical protein [Chloroflexota bacterium]
QETEIVELDDIVTAPLPPAPKPKSNKPKPAPKPKSNKPKPTSKPKKIQLYKDTHGVVWAEIPMEGYISKKELLSRLAMDPQEVMQLLTDLRDVGKLNSKRGSGYYRIVKAKPAPVKPVKPVPMPDEEEYDEEYEEYDEEDDPEAIDPSQIAALQRLANIAAIKAGDDRDESLIGVVSILWEEFELASLNIGMSEEYMDEQREKADGIAEDGMKIPVGLVGKLHGGKDSALVMGRNPSQSIDTFRQVMRLALRTDDYIIYPLTEEPEESESSDELKFPNPYMGKTKEEGWFSWG